MSVTSRTAEAGEFSHVIGRIEGIDGGRGRNPIVLCYSLNGRALFWCTGNFRGPYIT